MAEEWSLSQQSLTKVWDISTLQLNYITKLDGGHIENIRDLLTRFVILIP